MTISRSSIRSSRPMVRTTTLISSARFSRPAKTRPLLAMTEDGISAIFCVIAKIKSPYPADWSRICSNSDCPESSAPDPPPVPAVSLPVSTSLASSSTRTVSYWSSARYPPSWANANLKNPLVITPKMKFLNVFSNPLDSRTVTSSAPIRSSIAIPSDVPYNLDSIEYGLEKQERRSISLAYASLVSFPDFPAPTN